MKILQICGSPDEVLMKKIEGDSVSVINCMSVNASTYVYTGVVS